MLNNVEIIMMVLIFVTLLVFIFKPVKTAFNLDSFPTWVLSTCVSALCIIGMKHFLNGSIETILLPYTTLAICILVTLLSAFLFKMHKKVKDRLDTYLDGSSKPELKTKRTNEKVNAKQIKMKGLYYANSTEQKSKS